MVDSLMDLRNPAVVRRAGEVFERWTLNPDTVPKTADGGQDTIAIKAALEAVGVAFVASVERVHIHHFEATDVHLSLPMAENIQARLEKNERGDVYNLPSPYTELAPNQTDPAILKEFYRFRLGDYVLQHCA